MPWYNNRIGTLIDMINGNGNIRTHENICETYKVIKIDFLTYHKLKKSISNILKKTLKAQVYPVIHQPYIPKQISHLITTTNRNLNILPNIIKQEIEKYIKTRNGMMI